jgi:hypothetical protein
MLTDFESAWQQLREHLLTKSGHGTFGPEGLLATMARIEQNCAVDEPPTERMLRLFGVQISTDLIHTAGDASEEIANGDSISQAPALAPKEQHVNHRRTHRHRSAA